MSHRVLSAIACQNDYAGLQAPASEMANLDDDGFSVTTQAAVPGRSQLTGAPAGPSQLGTQPTQLVSVWMAW